ncbi:MAG: PD-(D/E)XK nuclease family protein [Candidatus Aenigmarchaeota archaeon]|nr:PD-(D/E)XK nuclease family protein [Candidatus Aenigmarchaeota archaeon]
MIDFDKMVDDHIAREHKPKQIGRYYPSEIGNCLRKLWYSYKYPQKIEPDLLKIFEAGNIIHGFVVEVLKSEKNKEVQLLQSEIPFKIEMEDYMISGRVDDLVIVSSNGKKMLIEVKSTKNLDAIGKPQHNHVMQLLFYMTALEIHEGLVLYVDKNNLKSKIFEVPFDQIKSAEIVDRFSFLHKHLKKDELPVDEAKKVSDMNWMCRYCEYKNKCDKNEK